MTLPSLLLVSKFKLKPKPHHLLSFSFSFSFSFSSHCKRLNQSHPSSLQSPPPTAKRVPFTATAHGRSWEDPYHWMRNTKDPDFLDYLNLENHYSEAYMADTKKLQLRLVEEMKRRIPETVSTPPERWGPWLYYQYIPEGKEYPVLCRRLDTGRRGWMKKLFDYASRDSGKEQILLDWNDIAEQYGYVHIGTCRVSPDHNFLAYTLDVTGSEQFMLQIKDLRSGSVLQGSQVDGVVSLAWAQDGCNLLYTICDENQRPFRVLCTKLGSDRIHDVPIYTENDSSFCVDITSTKDGKFITVNSNSRTSSEEGIRSFFFLFGGILILGLALLTRLNFILFPLQQVFVIDASKPLDSLRKIHQRIPGVQYFLEHHNGFFYILTNAANNGDDGKCFVGDYYLARCPVECFQSSDWQDIILPGKDMSFQDMDIFNGHLVLFITKNCFPMICSINLSLKRKFQGHIDIGNLDPWFFPLPSCVCSIAPGSNHDFMSPVYRVVLSSPVVPDLIVDYDMSNQTFLVVSQEVVKDIPGDPGSCSPSYDLDFDESHARKDGNKGDQGSELRKWADYSTEYYCEKREVVSHDGVEVPVTILYSRNAWKKGLSPGLLQGYGAYGEELDISWCSERLSLLDRGWVLAFADVRGGGGGSDPSWHKSGSGLNKLNSIHDFLSCGKYLISEGYVCIDQLGAIGISAGGLLVAAAINMDPVLFRAAILKVPFLDICNTLLDPSLPLTKLDYEEFGNPQNESHLESILRYSPYDNIQSNGCHPSTLVTASFHDSRVGVWEAAKWVAKVRHLKCALCSSSVVLKTNMNGGHFSEGGLYSHCEETAHEYAFLMKAMGLPHIE